jgi:hypothetical protein
VEEYNRSFEALVDGLRRGLDSFLAPATKPPAARPERRRRSASQFPLPGQRLIAAIGEQMPDWREVAADVARVNGRDDAGRLEEPDFGSAWLIERELLEITRISGARPDTGVLARRMAGHLAGRPLPPWEYVTVDLSTPTLSVPLFDDWQLCCVDRATDETLPLYYPSPYRDLAAPAALRLLGFGALRRPAGMSTLDGASEDHPDLLWPLVMLNLVTDAPVRAFTAYLVEPGRRIVGGNGLGGYYQPAEVAAWHPRALTLLPHRPQSINAEAATKVSQYAAEFGAHSAALSAADRRQFARAAQHHLYLAYHQAAQPLRAGHTINEGVDRTLGDLDPSYVAFRRTVTIEALLRGADSDHDSIGRKVAQRAAVLVGRDDDDRLATRDLIRAAYGARSAFAHGSGKTKPVNLQALASTTQMVMRRWLALAAAHGAKRLATLLDDALLSVTVRDDLLQTIAEHERRARGTCASGTSSG